LSGNQPGQDADTTTPELPDFFISRAGVDAPFAETIGRILEDAGHRVVLQQWDFPNRNFIERMHAALSSGARVIALLSNEYLASKYCEAEWQNAIASDPLNTKARLIVLRVNECAPRGLLTALAYWDLVPIRNQLDLVRDVVLTAIRRGRHKGEGTASARYWRAARPVLHREIRPTPTFTDRARELLRIGNAFRSGNTAAVAVHGLEGIGKSALAREYAHQAQNDYAGVWWLSGARAPNSEIWEGVERGLVQLGSIFDDRLDMAPERAKAARQTLEFVAYGGFAKPWLLVYDDVVDPAVLRQWAPVGNACVLVTSRFAAWGSGVVKVAIEQWPKRVATSYLRKESRRSNLTAANAEAIATALGRLPLALSHAAAYLRENENATAESYLGAIARHMREAPESAEDHRAVFATFQQQIKELATGARGILFLAAFYAPDDIPEELFTQSAELYPPALADVAADPLKLEEAIGALNRLSLIDFATEPRTFSVNRLVQAAARDALAGEAPQWAQGALRAASAAFPQPAFETWAACERLVSHVRMVVSHSAEDSRELYWLLLAAGTYLQERAALADVLPLYQRGLEIIDRLAQADPENAEWQRDLSVLHNKIGDVLRAQGDLAAALKSYQASHTMFDRLAQADPGNAECQRDLSISQDRIGDVLRAQGNLPAALDSYEASLVIADRLAKADPENARWQRDLSVSHNKIGDLLVAQDNMPAALDSYKASLAIRDRLAKADPENAEWQRDLSISQDRIGDLLQAQGNLPPALDSYKASLVIADRLAKADPENAEWQRDLSVSHNKVGDVLVAQDNMPVALDSYKASLAIRDRLAKADRGNADRQRDLCVSHNKIGDLLRAQGDLAAALKSYQASHNMFDRLAKADPENAEWQRDLSISQDRIGDVLRAQGNLPAALDSYKASLVIADRLAKADPENAEWQRDHALSHGRIGTVEARLGAHANALKAFREGRDIITWLKTQAPDNATLSKDIAWFDSQIAALER
jgi:tetratricopeptide (TPR) repeat protein